MSKKGGDTVSAACRKKEKECVGRNNLFVACCLFFLVVRVKFVGFGRETMCV